jgi:hypothetical protein
MNSEERIVNGILSIWWQSKELVWLKIIHGITCLQCRLVIAAGTCNERHYKNKVDEKQAMLYSRRLDNDWPTYDAMKHDIADE